MFTNFVKSVTDVLIQSEREKKKQRKVIRKEMNIMLAEMTVSSSSTKMTNDKNKYAQTLLFQEGAGEVDSLYKLQTIQWASSYKQESLHI